MPPFLEGPADERLLIKYMVEFSRWSRDLREFEVSFDKSSRPAVFVLVKVFKPDKIIRLRVVQHVSLHACLEEVRNLLHKCYL